MKSSQKNNKKSSAGIAVIALWMILAPLAVLYGKANGGAQLFSQFLQRPVIETVSYGVILVCAIGLLISKPWAWRTSIMLFFFYAIVNFYIVYFKIVPYFPQIIEFHSFLYSFSPLVVRNVLFLLIITSVVWPVVVILFLIHPKIKSRFYMVDLAEFRKTLGEIKPG